MKSTVNSVERGVKLALQTWETVCPDKVIAGLTLDQFREVVKPALESRTQLTALEVEWEKILAARQAADRSVLPVMRRMVHAIKGDPELGEDSGFYAALGYVKKSDRSSGLTRKREKEPATEVVS